MLFSFDKGAQFHHEPYPIGLVESVFSPEQYQSLVKNFPPVELFTTREHYGKKYSLSEVDNGPGYFEFIRGNPLWLEVYREIKSQEFIERVIKLLEANQIRLPLKGRKVISFDQFSPLHPIKKFRMDVLRKLNMAHHLNARFEFSMLPLDAGCILPHTDSPQKIITLVFSILDEGEWPGEGVGGGTSVLKVKDPTRNFNQLNQWLKFDDVDTLHTFPFNPNQCIVFVKTFNSWHSVEPMVAPGSKQMRKTLTINIEHVQKYYGSDAY